MSTPEGYRPHYLPLEEWPSACRAGWAQALQAPGLFDEARPASHWRGATEVKFRKGFGVYLHWLQQHESLSTATGPSGLVTRVRAEAFQAALIGSGGAPLTIYNRLQELYFAMRVLARRTISDGSRWP